MRQPHQHHYIWQRLYNALEALCGGESLDFRLAAAALHMRTLEDHDLPEGTPRRHLKYVLDCTARNAEAGSKPLSDADLRVLVQNLYTLLLWTQKPETVEAARSRLSSTGSPLTP